MPIHKIIYRIDYGLVYDVFDRPGTLIKEIASAKEGYFNDFQENRESREIYSMLSEDNKYICTINVSPNRTLFELESLDGIEFDSLNENQHFNNLFKVIDHLCVHFGIREVIRSGIRYFYFDKVNPEYEKTLTAFKGMYNPIGFDAIHELLGNSNDYLIYTSGASEDGVNYNLHLSPCATKYLKTYMSYMSSLITPLSANEYDFFVDIDLYESNLSLKSYKLYKWQKPITQKANSFIKSYQDLIRKI